MNVEHLTQLGLVDVVDGAVYFRMHPQGTRRVRHQRAAKIRRQRVAVKRFAFEGRQSEEFREEFAARDNGSARRRDHRRDGPSITAPDPEGPARRHAKKQARR